MLGGPIEQCAWQCSVFKSCVWQLYQSSSTLVRLLFVPFRSS